MAGEWKGIIPLQFNQREGERQQTSSTIEDVHHCYKHVLLRSWNLPSWNFVLILGMKNVIKNKHSFRNVVRLDFEHAIFKLAQILNVSDSLMHVPNWQSKNSIDNNQTFSHCVLLQHTPPEFPHLLEPSLPK